VGVLGEVGVLGGVRGRCRSSGICLIEERARSSRSQQGWEWGGRAVDVISEAQGMRCNCRHSRRTGLDSFTSNDVMRVVKSLCKDGTTIAATIRECPSVQPVG